MSEHDEQPILLRRHELFHLVEQMTGRGRIRRQDKPEPRWPVTAAVAAALVLQYVLPGKLILGVAHLHYVLLGLEAALVIALIAANPVRIERRSAPVRAASVTLIAAITAGNAASAVLLVRAILSGFKVSSSPTELLLAASAIWGTNVIAFALWYWEFDRGGPVSRLEGSMPYADFLFPQMTAPELTPPGWGPRFTDYLYLSFTNATAFSPTDVMPMARWAKVTMLVQSAVSLAVGVLVIARAVNILP